MCCVQIPNSTADSPQWLFHNTLSFINDKTMLTEDFNLSGIVWSSLSYTSRNIDCAFDMMLVCDLTRAVLQPMYKDYVIPHSWPYFCKCLLYWVYNFCWWGCTNHKLEFFSAISLSEQWMWNNLVDVLKTSPEQMMRVTWLPGCLT